jgi:exonuclease VII large subunit
MPVLWIALDAARDERRPTPALAAESDLPRRQDLGPAVAKQRDLELTAIDELLADDRLIRTRLK